MNILGLKLSAAKLLTLAQNGIAVPDVGAEGATAAPVNPLVQFAPMLITFVVMFYFIVMRPQNREQRKRAELLSALKKNDKVVTIGGIIGTIVDISGDGSRMTLKVDDGTRIKFIRSSIQGPYDEKSEAESTGS